MGWLSSQFRMEGGLNEEDPQFTQKPGAAAFMRNYECLPGGGYRRIGGYERFMGAYPEDEAKTYTKVAFVNGINEPPSGFPQVATYPSAAILGYLAGVILESGSWGEGTAAGWLIFTAAVGLGSPPDGDVLRLNLSGIVIGEPASDLLPAELSDTRHDDWVALSKDYWRDTFYTAAGGALGAGPVQGMFIFNDKLYAWRSLAADTTKIGLFEATGSGWSQFAPEPYLPFWDGTGDISRGVIITGHTSGATATVYDINISFGNWSGPSYATGRLYLTNRVGTFQLNEELWVAGAKCALVEAPLVTPAPISGTQLARHGNVASNFYGAENRKAIYGVDGYNDPYVFDGQKLMYFDNLMTNKPLYVEVHRNHLFLAYAGGSVQNSSLGLPMVWSVRQGASELGIGDNPTGMKSNGNNTLAVMAEKSVHIITGTSDLDWNVRVIADEMVTVQDTIAAVGGQTLFLDHSGVSWLLPAPPTYQDYTTQQISRVVRKTLETMAPRAVFAISVPHKSQYRLFFDDKTFLIASFFGNKLVGWSKCLYAHQMTCAASGTVTGEDNLFMGTDDGYVMLCDYDTSFAGETIQSIIQTPFSYHGHADRDKRFHKITLEMETPAPIDLRLHMDFDYGTGAQTGNFVASTGATGGQWDISHWEAFFWDSGVLTAPETNIDGVGRSVAITLYHDTRTAMPFIVSAAFLQFSPYGVKR